MGGGIEGVIFYYQILSIKYDFYFGLSMDLGILKNYRLHKKFGFFHSNCLSSIFRASEGTFAPLFSAFDYIRSTFRSGAVVAVALPLLLLWLLLLVQLLIL